MWWPLRTTTASWWVIFVSLWRSVAYFPCASTVVVRADHARNFGHLQDLVSLMEAEDASREDGTSIAGTLVRLAWHTSGTYSKVRFYGAMNSRVRSSP